MSEYREGIGITPISKEGVRKIKKMRDQGKTYAEIAEEIGCSLPTVAKYCKGAMTSNVSAVYVTPELIEKMLKLQEQGLTYRQIATKTGASYATVSRYVRMYKGKKIRPKVERKPKREYPKQREIDKGKIMALWRAGWTLQEIAADVHKDPMEVAAVIRRKKS